jgi:hypothetical protein
MLDLKVLGEGKKKSTATPMIERYFKFRICIWGNSKFIVEGGGRREL